MCRAGTQGTFLFLLLLNLPSAELNMMDFGKCNQPLGMADGRIKDENLSFTTSSNPNHGLNSTRFGHTDKEGRITAWCPLFPAKPQDRLEYIKVELIKEYLITRVERRLFSEDGDELEDTEPASATFIQYYRPKIGDWKFTKYKHNLKQGDSPDSSLLKPFRATSVVMGFNYYVLHNEVKYCLQVEIYGCPVSDGIVSYNIKRSLLHPLYMNYDGNIGELLSEGLGDLVDGDFGDQFLTVTNDLTPESLQRSDNGWIGWNKEWQDSHPVEFIFEFDGVRRFFEMVVYALNIIAKEEIRPFLLAKVHFSNDAIDYMEDYSIAYETPPQIQNISIPLQQRSAKYLKIQFFLDTKWMFISEITFNSSLVKAVVRDMNDIKVNEVSSSSTDPPTEAVFQNIGGADVSAVSSSTVTQSSKAVFQSTTGKTISEVTASSNNPWFSMQDMDDIEVNEVSSSSTKPFTEAVSQNIDGVDVIEVSSSTVTQSSKAVFQSTTSKIISQVTASSNNPWLSGRILISFIVLAIIIGLLIMSPFVWLVIKLRRVMLTNSLNNASREEVLYTMGTRTPFPLRG